MVANTPERIYINPLLMEEGESIVRHCTFERQSDSQVEYIHTDAFIEKAVSWLKEHKEAVETEDNGIMGWIPDYFIEDFVNYMKGE